MLLKPNRNQEWKKLLKAAKDCPKCMSCGKHNDGTIVAAHSNKLTDGKGTGIKSYDYRIAYVCHDCHHAIDVSKIRRMDRDRMWEKAHRATIGYLFEQNIIGVK